VDEFDNLGLAEQQALLKSLVLHAHDRMRRRSWRGGMGGISTLGTPEEVVALAVSRLLDGTRARNRSRYPTLLDQLRSIINSLISDAARSYDNRLVRNDASGGGDFEDAGAASTHDLVATKEIWDRVVAGAVNAAANDPLLIEAMALFESGKDRPRDLADALSLTPKEAANLKKRLRRLLRQAHHQATQETPND